MPRVSQEHSDARRRQILAAGRRCFAANGFHATSMQDLLREMNLSAGAFYRYFSGKDELINAIAEEAVDQAADDLAAFFAQEPLPPLPDLLAGVAGAGITPMVDRETQDVLMQIWAESMRAPELRKRVQAGFVTLLGLVADLMRRYRERGELPPDADPDACAQAVIGLIQGYLLQRSVMGLHDPEPFVTGVRTLLSPR
ncbi:TetR/AcrR family transcriptional regulator [Actinacidiphila acidipaludis]|uniref:TetR/AcrR family transcriptional regulator n=1 Tax=Actinacidiphila acidipaludis TaxID=2873382 RepID=A0ABS7QCL3_9ACTN|nr:TetR/AcrR family transcriptional regulator [Streptomyces acidipaludis]MBY8880561.1 TetR/AcrR family transcriptional regulator [Streptomyces acidipaludis]